jgi:hypothetical protein
MIQHMGHRLTVEYRKNQVVLFCKDDKDIVLTEERNIPDAVPLEIYAQVILHQGCAIPPKNETESRLHKWYECRSQRWFMRVARKHQYKLKSNKIVIGDWIKRTDLLEECLAP